MYEIFGKNGIDILMNGEMSFYYILLEYKLTSLRKINHGFLNVTKK